MKATARCWQIGIHLVGLEPVGVRTRMCLDEIGLRGQQKTKTP
ncbi:hypothetical protein [Paraburkholderia humisilvae]|uniref:Uncharacterized protein n=1 Tax=Paraburkholderia humisilvae TaxID=627669 RepID=A0A6J5DHM7_9BURK|nr:hypothetical protein [Paraburkholderia humisilvae]CAB3752974.1 hypothetical protein LMG29542_01934 [Paraburkholderia humisilvae]